MTTPSNPREALEQAVARVTIDPGDETVAPDISHVLARGFHAMGWSNPQAAAADMIKCVAAVLTALPPTPEARESIARAIYMNRTGCSESEAIEHFAIYAKHPLGYDGPRIKMFAALRDADAILSSGLVQDEAAIRAEFVERELDTANSAHRVLAKQLADTGRALTEAVEILKDCDDALSRCYNVTDYPADGTTVQDLTLEAVRAFVKSQETK